MAVGSDGADKQELDVAVLARADRVVADSLPQCRRIGEIHHALVAGVLDEAAVTELGQIVAGAAPGRRSDAERIVCDLTGVGVQDVAAARVGAGAARAATAGAIRSSAPWSRHAHGVDGAEARDLGALSAFHRIAMWTRARPLGWSKNRNSSTGPGSSLR